MQSSLSSLRSMAQSPTSAGTQHSSLFDFAEINYLPSPVSAGTQHSSMFDFAGLNHLLQSPPPSSRPATAPTAMASLPLFADHAPILTPAAFDCTDLANLLAMQTSSTVGTAIAATQQPSQDMDRQLDLIMRYLDCCHSTRSEGSTIARGWLLRLLSRSRVVWQCALSMAARQASLELPPGSEARDSALREAEEYRTRAVRLFEELPITSLVVVGENLIAAVQLAQLEAKAKRLPECQSYLGIAAQTLICSGSLRHQPTVAELVDLPQQPAPSSARAYFDCPERAGDLNVFPGHERPRETDLDWQAAYESCALLILNDTFSCSVKRTKPTAAEAYQKLLSVAEFSAVFRTTNMFAEVALLCLLDIVALDEWRGERQKRGELSYRELLSRANEIERRLDESIQQLATTLSLPHAGAHSSAAELAPALPKPISRAIDIGTHIILQAALIELQLILSGPSLRAPEVKQSVRRFISTWTTFRPAISSLALAWPFCIAASAATDSDRDFFQGITTDSSTLFVQDIRRLLELSWHEIDRPASGSGEVKTWKDIMLSTNTVLLFL
ncbi:unnamed protein product [Zymoseptoria tritici ST99CH_1A5]|nr:unnamed protein product [Zymoseptoria tritici ST99CH_1E4]SMR51937.1 unnamed protein product [Zymoseptoria tritici ST99CH_3D1]SMY23691.1 unnamed protein product [Zymoseptoria tritici ST99CH_1A5]